jgi:NET1-associated nuclear protein 1 (U3 small nucleolar RNA-associated protein 17)
MSGTAISNPPGDQKKKHKKRKRESNIAGSLAKRPRGDGEDGHDGTNGALKGHGKVQSQRSGLSKPTDANASDWQVSKPMGGRMLDIDPILSEDEQYVLYFNLVNLS